MDFLFITNQPDHAIIAQGAGVERVMVDLELNGKDARQGHLNTVISRHAMEDVSVLRDVLDTSQLLVRCNPLFEESRAEIDDIIARGADQIMLPMFQTADEAAQFASLVDGRCKTTLLAETTGALARMPQIAEVEGIDDIHIGLNDMHLGLQLNFMFEILSEGLLDHMAGVLKQAGRTFGFGGVAPLGQGTLPAETVLSEHHRLGSNQVILSRDFGKLLESPTPEDSFHTAVQAARAHLDALSQATPETLADTQKDVRDIVRAFVAKRMQAN